MDGMGKMGVSGGAGAVVFCIVRYRRRVDEGDELARGWIVEERGSRLLVEFLMESKWGSALVPCASWERREWAVVTWVRCTLAELRDSASVVRRALAIEGGI